MSDFIQVLSQHITNDDLYENDKNLLLSALEYFVQDINLIGDTFILVKAIVTRKTLVDEDVFRLAEDTLSFGLLNQTSELINKNELIGVRIIINELLKDGVDNKSLLCVDVLLVSEEHGHEKGIDRLEEILPYFSTHHQVGIQADKNRLYNMYGCFLDELNRHKEALDAGSRVELMNRLVNT